VRAVHHGFRRRREPVRRLPDDGFAGGKVRLEARRRHVAAVGHEVVDDPDEDDDPEHELEDPERAQMGVVPGGDVLGMTGFIHDLLLNRIPMVRDRPFKE